MGVLSNDFEVRCINDYYLINYLLLFLRVSSARKTDLSHYSWGCHESSCYIVCGSNFCAKKAIVKEKDWTQFMEVCFLQVLSKVLERVSKNTDENQ